MFGGFEFGGGGGDDRAKVGFAGDEEMGFRFVDEDGVIGGERGAEGVEWRGDYGLEFVGKEGVDEGASEHGGGGDGGGGSEETACCFNCFRLGFHWRSREEIRSKLEFNF